MVYKKMTRLIRRYLVGKDQDFVFRHETDFKFPKIKEIDLYVHIPFCKNMCPYCPYNRIRYDKKLVKPFLDAILSEIDIYARQLGDISISSIYIGGGTPTNTIDEVGIILERIKDNFKFCPNIGIETNPKDINGAVLDKLRGFGINLISLGIQSFNDKHLAVIGRNYRAKGLESIIELTTSYGFDTVNLDIMFALPGQTNEDLIEDLEKAINTGADQITTYPLFTFPYSTAGRYLKLKKVKMPNIFTRRRMYRSIHTICSNNGFKRISVWGFKRGDTPRYSSVTRDYYLGFGPGAGSYLPNGFYFNTFSVKEYMKKCSNKESPLALKMDIGESLSKYYWLYWRLYDTYIAKEQLGNMFGPNDKKIKRFLLLSRLLKMSDENKKGIELTERGSFWIHLMQNYFVLNYINNVWSIAMEDPWPKEIRI